ncbi:hypothetical protein [Scytonema sp. NUACC26]|uniref:hypothetical protein n=1 Tax=Scytonema sp. NUACC26 TaxID=3140176 RepID=UPI0034DCAA49
MTAAELINELMLCIWEDDYALLSITSHMYHGCYANILFSDKRVINGWDADSIDEAIYDLIDKIDKQEKKNE